MSPEPHQETQKGGERAGCRRKEGVSGTGCKRYALSGKPLGETVPVCFGQV